MGLGWSLVLSVRCWRDMSSVGCCFFVFDGVVTGSVGARLEITIAPAISSFLIMDVNFVVNVPSVSTMSAVV